MIDETRPDLQPMDFVAWCQRAGVGEHEVASTWQTFLEVIRAAYLIEPADLNIGQFLTFIDALLDRMDSSGHRVMSAVIESICQFFPSLGVMRSHEELVAFTELCEIDKKFASQMWTALLRDGLGIFLGSSDARKSLRIPHLVIRAAVESDTMELRRIGPLLEKVLWLWMKSFTLDASTRAYTFEDFAHAARVQGFDFEVTITEAWYTVVRHFPRPPSIWGIAIRPSSFFTITMAMPNCSTCANLGENERHLLRLWTMAVIEYS